MSIDYTLFYKDRYHTINEFVANSKWDLFISAYNDSQRVKDVFNSADAKIKHWLILPEYNYLPTEYPVHNNVYSYPNIFMESEFILAYFDEAGPILENGKFCIDITGFMRPHLIFLIKYLSTINITNFDVVYTDPEMYETKEKTVFTIDSVEDVRQIIKCEGVGNPDTSNDILLIGSGYDNKLISNVAERKDKARKVQLFGFPSLQPDMYQENLIKAHKAEDSLGGNTMERTSSLFAPANDPFVTAKVIQEFVDRENSIKPISNLYLSPLSTKAQTLGFVLYYIWECVDKPVSILFPFTNRYSRETTVGISKIWKYNILLPNE